MASANFNFNYGIYGGGGITIDCRFTTPGSSAGIDAATDGAAGAFSEVNFLTWTTGSGGNLGALLGTGGIFDTYNYFTALNNCAFRSNIA